MKIISIIIPVYNELENINLIYKGLLANLNKKKYFYEIIFVNDGSEDGSQKIIELLCKKDINVKSIKLSRNFGQQYAILAGYHNSIGDIIVSIDCDMQDSPTILKNMLKKILNGYDIVYTKRNIEKKGDILTYIFYKILKFTTRDFLIEEFVGEYRMFNKKVLLELNKLTEKNIYLPGLFFYLGFKYTIIDFERKDRKKGISGYNFRRLYKYAMNGIIGNSTIFIIIGYILCFFSFLAGLIFFLLNRELLNLILIFFIGLLFIYISFIYEYLYRINMELKNRPSYIIDKKINF